MGEEDIEFAVFVGMGKQGAQEQVDTVDHRVAFSGRRPLTNPCGSARPPEGSQH
jgi:hypothetical protein